MAWIGVAMVAAGGVLVYSAYKGLSPWQEFLTVLATGRTAPFRCLSAASRCQSW